MDINLVSFLNFVTSINRASPLNWVTAIGALIASIVGIVTIIILTKQSRLTKRTIDISVLLELEARFEKESMLQKRKKASNSLLSKKNLGARENLGVLDDVLNFFELIGLLLGKGALDQEMVTSEFSFYAYCYWEASHEYIKQIRSRDPNYWIHYEELIKAMNKINDDIYKKPLYLPTKADVKEFLLAESKLLED